MNYPLISEYVEAIKAAEDNFDQLKHLRPVLGEDGEPVMTSGNFAVVFKMKDEQTGKLHAVKCFLKEQKGRAEAYRQIAEELEFVSSTFLTPIKYLDKELFVDSANSEDSEFPVLLMDWVEGQTLDKYIREHINDQYELSLLAYQFSRLAMWLMPQPFAHGDLKPDNILVKEDGTLVLVDYDGMYVPAMKGQKARELGSPDFRHPGRTEEVFDDHIDDFSLASILLSLKAIALQPSLLEEYGASDRLLFSEKDYRNLPESSALGALQPLMQDAELASLYSLYILALSQNNLSQVSFRLFNLSRPDRSQYEEENLSTEVTEEDLANAWTDEFGVMYSKDRKKLLKVPTEIRTYSIENGTKIICNKAFQSTLLTQVIIPNSVLCIGDNAFCGCCLTSIEIPDNVQSIGKWAFSYNALNSVTIPQNVKHIGKGAFGSCGSLICIDVDNENKFYDSRNDCNAIIETKSNTLIVGCQNTIIPNNVKSIGERAFYGCYNLSFIFIPKEVLNIELRAFDSCEILKRISVDNENKFFDSRNDCNAIIETKTNTLIVGCQNTIIPNNVNCIGEWAFSGCNKLSAINIPESVLSINEGAFSGCSGLSTIELPKGLKELGRRVFSNSGIESVIIPDGIEVISESLFNYCRRLTSVTLPNSVTTIDNSAFQNCRPLSFISMSDKVIAIGDWAFACCSSLPSIMLSNSVQTVGKGAFYNCESLKTIFIPLHSKKKFEQLLPDYKDIIVEQDEDANLSTEVTKEDLANARVDNYGAKYSEDWKRLLKGPNTKVVESMIVNNQNFKKADMWVSDLVINKKTGKPTYWCSFDSFEDGVLLFLCKSIWENLSIVNQDTVWEVLSKGNYIIREAHDPETNKWLMNEYNCPIMMISPMSEMAHQSWGSNNIEHYYKELSDVTDYAIKEGTECICDSAFKECYSLKKLIIPSSVRKISESSFVGCVKLKSIIVDDNNKIYDSRNNCNAIIESNSNTIILGCSSTIIPESVTSIGDSAFFSCMDLETISIPDSVEKIGYAAFPGCDSLKSIIIPSSVNEIGNAAFLNCKALTNVEILGGIKAISYRTFYNCEALQYVKLPESILKIGEEVFYGCNHLKQITIPVGTKEKFEQLLTDYKDKLVEQELGWTVKDTRQFNAEEISMVSRAVVVPSDDGNSVCFFMQTGGQTYLPLSRQSKLTVGDSVDMKTVKLITLYQKGKADITRVIE